MIPMPHPPCSLDLTLTDFFLFPLMKKVLEGKHFANVEKVKQKMAEALKGIKIDEFENGIGNTISIGVLYQMESTLKVTKV